MFMLFIFIVDWIGCLGFEFYIAKEFSSLNSVDQTSKEMLSLSNDHSILNSGFIGFIISQSLSESGLINQTGYTKYESLEI